MRAYRDRAVKVLLRAGFDKQCMLCGSSKKVHCHHIDENPKNNDVSNLMFLCKKCHSGVHNGRIIFGSD